MVKNRAGSLIAAVGLSLFVSACSGDMANDTGKGSKGEGSVPQTAKDSPPKPVSLTLVSISPKEEMEAVYLEPLRKKYPHFDIRYIQNLKADGTTIPELLATGVKFDLYTNSRGGFEETLLDYDLKYDMSDLIRKHNVDIGHLEPTAIASMRQMFEGKIYGLPVKMNSLLLYYNKTLFDTFGVSYPKDGMSWAETLELANKMTRSDGKTSNYGIGSHGTGAMIGWNPYSIPLVDGNKRTPTIQTDERWKTLIQAVLLNPVFTKAYKEIGKIPDWSSFSKDRNVAMLLYTAAAPLALTKDFSSLDWDMTSFPVLPGLAEVGSQVSPNYFGVTSLSENKDAAMEAVKFWTSLDYFVENSQGGTLMASRAKEVREALGTKSPFPNKNWKAVTYYPFAPLAPTTNADSKVRSVYEKHMNSLLSGAVDLNTGLRTMAEESLKTINEQPKP
ncbi:MAG: extracellular solute-binding protein family 1 [Paenibacillus sp.]|nr:extracellular solute-binding protein family 1 [Paenibacillus sp.]